MEFLTQEIITLNTSTGGILIKVLLNALALFAAAYLMKSVEIQDFIKALVVAVILAVMNATLGYVLKTISYPITLLTLGLFSFVIDAAVILLTSNLVKGFKVDGFWPAFWLAVLIAIFNSILYQLYL